MLKKGYITFYDKEKKYGFILTESKEKLYFRNSSVKAYNTNITEGLYVEVDVIKDNNGYSARFVNIIQNYFLPKDTLEILPTEVDNYYLLFNKLVDINIKRKQLPKFNNELVKDVNDRRQYLINELKNNGYEVVSRELILDGKLCIGLGQVSVYETSLNLDFINGIPYIPASSIKGLVKSWINQEKCDLNIKDLGNENEIGKVIILDTYPKYNLNITLDIMNPHFGNYYSSKGDLKPTDDSNPIPVNFPIVYNTVFEFTIISKLLSQEVLIKWMNKIQEALSFNGVGAKTSIGYGSFKPYINQAKSDLHSLVEKFNNRK